MGLLEGSIAVGSTFTTEHCWEWGSKYMGYNLCSVRQGISLALGLISVMSWGVAEIPQILTNYKQKSTDGLSLAFLMAWILGDLFNLFGCMLEPATLPTQYYTAMLYTITTMVLSVQTIYYGYIYPRFKDNLRKKKGSQPNLTEVPGKARKSYTDFVGKQVNHTGRSHGSDIPSAGNVLSSPIPLPGICPSNFPGRESYYISARSLSKSHTPTAGSYFAQRMTPTFNANEEPLLGALASTQSAPSNNVKTVLCVVSLISLFGTFNHRSADNNADLIVENPNQGVVLQVGRKLLQVSSGLLSEKGTKGSSRIGHFLGWGMAAIYIGGRLPQILLNIRRGNVEGLNPLMFVFAVVGNATYVASIIVNSLEWSKIRPNLPWLVDAGGCVLLDAFILIQFFRCWRHQDPDGKDGHSNAA